MPSEQQQQWEQGITVGDGVQDTDFRPTYGHHGHHGYHGYHGGGYNSVLPLVALTSLLTQPTYTPYPYPYYPYPYYPYPYTYPYYPSYGYGYPGYR